MSNEWMDIETAPKDGTNILLYSNCDGIHEGFWFSGTYDEGWCVQGMISDCWTHWRPILQEAAPVGKKLAGRELDGRLWDEYPGATDERV